MPRERDKTNNSLFGEGLLGESLAPKKSGMLAEKFMIPPFTVLSAREGWWQERKRAWLSLGIQSELGRGADMAWGTGNDLDGFRNGVGMQANKAAPGGSAMPGMNYKNRERGTGTGNDFAGTSASLTPDPAPEAPVSHALPPMEALVPVTMPAPPQRPVSATAAPKPRFSMPTLSVDAPAAPKPPRAPAAAKNHQHASFSAPSSSWVPPAELPRLIGAKRISIDVETRDEQLTDLGPGVRRPDCYIAGIAIGRDDGGRWYLPIRHDGGDNLDPETVLAWARSELNNFDGEVVGTNINYDLDFLAQEGVTFAKTKRFRDIQVAEPLLDENRLQFGLEVLAQDYLKEGKHEELLMEAARAYGFGKTAKDLKTNLWRLPARYVGAYAESDVDLPLRILPLQEAELEKQGLTELFDLESRLTPVLLGMRRRGVRVDLNRAEQVREILIKERDKWLKAVRSYAGSCAELMAAESLAPALRSRGLHVPSTAKTNKPSIAKTFFEQNRGDPLVDAIAAGRRCQTLISTFLDGHILGHHINGRIHTTFNQLKSDDGGTIARLSSSSPNLQNVPSRKNDIDDSMDFGEDVVQLIRGIFLPEEGEQWARHDLSQIEYRYLTHFAVGPGSDEARAAYVNDPKTDFHKLCAKLAKIDPEDKSMRKKTKGTNFCKVYGGGAKKIAVTIGCSLQEAEAFIEMYDRELPFVKNTLEKASEWANKRGFVTTILNRRGRFPLWVPQQYGDSRPPKPYDCAVAEYGQKIKRYMTYAALSRKLQGSAADHIKTALVKTHEAGITSVLGLLLTVHDENDYSMPNTEAAREALAEARNIMETCIQLKVPVLADQDIGADWGATS